MKRQKMLKKYMKILEEIKIEEPTKNSFSKQKQANRFWL